VILICSLSDYLNPVASLGVPNHICVLVVYSVDMNRIDVTRAGHRGAMAADELNLRMLRMFVVVAEELHFTQSAKRLFMSQPALTRRVRSLEQSLGVQLFSRDTRSVTLTSAGKVLLREAKRVLDAAEVAVSATLRASEGGDRSLSLGCVESAAENLVPRVMTAFCKSHSRVSVDVLQMHTRELERALLCGTIDCAILRPPLASTELEAHLLYTEPMIAAVPESFEVEGPSVGLEKLRDARFIIHSEELGTSVSLAISQICISAGFVPNIAESATSTIMVLGMVAAGMGVALLPKSYTLTSPFGVRMLSIEDSQSVCGMAVAHRRGTESDSLLADLLLMIERAAPGVPDTTPAIAQH
jgi:DNA-binding transcriptional LysR family regulator